jgi:hypothetical protein
MGPYKVQVRTPDGKYHTVSSHESDWHAVQQAKALEKAGAQTKVIFQAEK